MAFLVVLIVLVLLGAAAFVYARNSNSLWMRRKRMALMVERTTPGPQREAARLRVHVFESLESANALAAGSPTVSGLLDEARAVGTQLDGELAVLVQQRDPQQISRQLPEARRRVEELVAMVDRIGGLGTMRSQALLEDGMRQLQGSIETERAAQDAGARGLAQLQQGGLLTSGDPLGIPAPPPSPPAAGPPHDPGTPPPTAG